MGHPVTFHGSGIGQRIYITYIAGLARQFDKGMGECIKTKSSFRTDIVSRNMEIIIEPFATVTDIRARDIDTCTTLVHIFHQVAGTCMVAQQPAETNVIKVQPVCPVILLISIYVYS